MEKMNKIVYNSCYGGFALSNKGISRLKELGAEYNKDYGFYYIKRHDYRLIQTIEELGEEASGTCSKLKIDTIYGDRYRIDEYDGRETVIEPSDGEWIVIK